MYKKIIQLDEYIKIQGIAKIVLNQLNDYINSESTEKSLASQAKQLLQEQGITQTWYHEVPAFVLLGSRSCLSISGKEYQPSNESVGDKNLVTVDLSPKIGSILGDCARSFVVEKSVTTTSPEDSEFREGLYIEKQLHKEMLSYANPETKFSQLYEFANDLISQYGYENLDFLNNLGHSIEKIPSNRLYIDKQCQEPLGKVPFFTFEPHIKKRNSHWGFKHENIYYFNNNGKIIEL